MNGVPGQVTTKTVLWQDFDDIWILAARYYNISGYTNISDLVDDIRTLNPLVLNWRRVATNSTLSFPVLVG